MDWNKNEFVVLKSYMVHYTKLSDVCAQLGKIKGNLISDSKAIVNALKRLRKIITKFINQFLFLLTLGTQRSAKSHRDYKKNSTGSNRK